MKLNIPYFKQEKNITCGVTCLRMVFAFYGKNVSESPRFDNKEKIWKVPVLCKTERGVIIAGEFHINKNGDFVNVPTKKEMMKTVELQVNKLPFLYYGTKKELHKQKITPVTI
jgi:hypothetical protein